MDTPLDPDEAAASVGTLGWRHAHGALITFVRVNSLGAGADVAARAVAACQPHTDDHLSMDLRPRHVLLALRSVTYAQVTRRDVVLATRISEDLASNGSKTNAQTAIRASQSLQVAEVALYSRDVPLIRPFWKAVTGYDDEAAGPRDPLVDPVAQGSAISFEQTAAHDARHGRVRLEVHVPYDEALRRVQAAIQAGGTLLSDQPDPVSWLLADAEGNEIRLSGWHGRDA